ncbi:MAG TPA: formyltransferase family protein [Candidatus Limnocylindrales bacterium]
MNAGPASAADRATTAGAPDASGDVERSPVAVSSRVAVVFVVRIVSAVIGVANAFILARLLEPVGKGDFYLVQLVPSTLLVLGQFGLPSAISYYAGSGRTAGLGRVAVFLSLFLAGAGMAITVAILPLLEGSVFRLVDPSLIVLALAIVPFTYLFTFGNALLTGRQRVSTFGAIAVGQSIAALLLFVLLIWVLGLGVTGALTAYLLYTSGAAVAAIWYGVRSVAGPSRLSPVPMRDLLAYGARLYPASLSGFFSYRADVYILALVVGDPAQLGLYSVAVGLAELAFFLPDSVVTVFFPHVAGGTRAEADAAAPVVTRITILATLCAVIPLAIASYIAVNLLLPAYVGSLPALWVLLPGIVLLSASKTLSAYLNGINKSGLVSITAVIALATNVAVNLILIPRYGIVGAAAASLVSYSLSGAIEIGISSRFTGRPYLSFLIPSRSDWVLIRSTLLAFIERIRKQPPGAPGTPSTGADASRDAAAADPDEQVAFDALDPSDTGFQAPAPAAALAVADAVRADGAVVLDESPPAMPIPSTSPVPATIPDPGTLPVPAVAPPPGGIPTAAHLLAQAAAVSAPARRGTARRRLRVYVAGARDARITEAALTALVRNPGVDLVGLDFARVDPTRLREAKPDLLISAAHQYLIRPSELAVARVGSVGLHPALLPRYRGSYPLWWALQHRESEAGLTLYELDRGIDTGPILAQERVAIARDDTFASLYTRVSGCVGPLLDGLIAVAATTDGLPARFAQDETQATSFAAPNRRELHGTIVSRLVRRAGLARQHLVATIVRTIHLGSHR